MKRPKRTPLEGCILVSDVTNLNDYIDWLEGKGPPYDGTEVSHDTEHVCEDEAGPIPNRIEGHAFGKGGTKTYHPSGGEEEGAD